MMSAKTYNQLQLKVLEKLILLLAWAWLAKAKGHSCHTKKLTFAKTFTEKKRVKVRSKY